LSVILWKERRGPQLNAYVQERRDDAGTQRARSFDDHPLGAQRLDINRPVSRELIAECLEIAFKAPNGSNQNTWQWLVIDDR
jgi:nitroreductase